MVTYTVKNPKSQWHFGVRPCSSVSIVNFEHVIAGKELANFLFMLPVIFISFFEKLFLLCKVVTLLSVLQNFKLHVLLLLSLLFLLP